MCHSPAKAFKIVDRGYIKEGYWADIAIVDLDKKWKVSKENTLYKCKWSPLEQKEFTGEVQTVLVNGAIAMQDNKIISAGNAKRLLFEDVR